MTQPAAARLAAINPEEFTVVTVRAGGSGLAVGVQAPGWAARVAMPGGDTSAADRIESIRAALDRMDERIAALRPKQPIVAKKVTSGQERYFTLKELAGEIAEKLDSVEARLESRRHDYLEARQPEAIGRRARHRAIKNYEDPLKRPLLASIISSFRMEEAIRELLDDSEPLPGDQELFDLENRLALLRLMAEAPDDEKPTYLLVRTFPDGGPDEHALAVAALYRSRWSEGLGIEVLQAGRFNGASVLQLKGLPARPLALMESGTHLVVPRHGSPVPVRVDCLDGWPAQPADPFTFGSIVRVLPEGRAIFDVRTGLVCPPPYDEELFRTLTLAALPRA